MAQDPAPAAACEGPVVLTAGERVTVTLSDANRPGKIGIYLVEAVMAPPGGTGLPAISLVRDSDQ